MAWAHDLWSDVQYAHRQMLRARGLTALIVLTLATGIGANTTMAGAIERLVLRAPKHIGAPNEVVRLLVASPMTRNGNLVGATASYPTLVDFQAEVTAFSSIAAYSTMTLSFGTGPDATEVRTTVVSSAFFSTLRVQPLLGRVFAPTDGFSTDQASGGQPLAVLGYAFWQRAFGGDSGVIGRVIRVGIRSYTVIGVAPNGFRGVELTEPDMWLPITVTAEAEAPQLWFAGRGSSWVSLVARLHVGATAAVAELAANAAWRRHNPPRRGELSPSRIVVAKATPTGGADMPREIRVVLWLTGVSTLVLLISCANVASLLLARAFTRRREIAVRMALGAGPWRLARQLLVETLFLAVIGGAAALYVAIFGDMLLHRLLVTEVPADAGDLSHRFVFTATVALTAALLIGLVPLVQLRWRDLVGALRTGGGAGGGRTVRMRSALVAVQAALCTILLVGAGLFASSLRHIEGLDLGMDHEHTLMVSFDLSRLGLPKPELDADYRLLREHAAHVPGVASVALADKNPYRNGWAVPAHTLARSADYFWHEGVMQAPMAAAVDSGFFRTVGATVRGRDFGTGDRADSPSVAIINEPLAQLLWPHENAVGQCMLATWSDADRKCVTIVGVVQGYWRRDIINRDQYLMYVPLAQRPVQRPAGMFISISGDPVVVAGQLRSTLQRVVSNMPAIHVTWMRDVLEPELKPWRMAAVTFSLFGLLALAMSVIGLYGLVSFTAQQRSTEIAVRRALGARPRHILETVARDGLRAVVVGLVAGGAVALIGARSLGPLLFQTSPSDPAAIVAAMVLLLSVALVATMLPTARALRTAVASALRVE